MKSLRIVLDLTQNGFLDGEAHELEEHTGELVIGGIPGKAVQGNPIMMIGLRRPDGSFLVAQTTLALFLTAADALRLKYGDPRT